MRTSFLTPLLLSATLLLSSCDQLTPYLVAGTYLAADGSRAVITTKTATLYDDATPQSGRVVFDYTVDDQTLNLGNAGNRGMLENLAMAFSSLTITIQDHNTLIYEANGLGHRRIVYRRKS